MNVNVFTGLDSLNDFADLGAVFLQRVTDLAVVSREFVPERNVLRNDVGDLLIRDEIAPNALGTGGDVNDRNRYIVGWIVNQKMNHDYISSPLFYLFTAQQPKLLTTNERRSLHAGN